VRTALREDTDTVTGIETLKDSLVNVRLIHMGHAFVLGSIGAGQGLDGLQFLELLLDDELGVRDDLDNSRSADILGKRNLIAHHEFNCKFGAESSDAERVTVAVSKLDGSRASLG
jgi:hypothetical protein